MVNKTWSHTWGSLKPLHLCWVFSGSRSTLLSNVGIDWVLRDTGRKFWTCIKEHQTDVSQNMDKRQFTRSQRKTSLGEFQKSAITDHDAPANHSVSKLFRDKINSSFQGNVSFKYLWLFRIIDWLDLSQPRPYGICESTIEIR